MLTVWQLGFVELNPTYGKLAHVMSAIALDANGLEVGFRCTQPNLQEACDRTACLALHWEC
jgi:hypothetical protein